MKTLPLRLSPGDDLRAALAAALADTGADAATGYAELHVWPRGGA
jgi:hypothetical protein